MYFSKYTIFSKIHESEKYYIVNLLSGNADILEASDVEEIHKVMEGKSIPETFFNELTEKGYITDPREETKLYNKKYLDFIDQRETDEIQLFYVPNYSCNFACSYCYQDHYSNPAKESDKKIIDAFFEYIKKEFASRKKYITLFGGEPLLSSPEHKKLIEYFFEKSTAEGIEICVVTNGYTLTQYIDILRKAKIREIQVTLDGTREVHDNRRFLKNKEKTFDQIVTGIDACLSNSMPVNLRMVIDKDNIDNLPEFAQFAIDKGWTKNKLFKTQLGRNYELHHCQSTPDKLFTRISLYEKIYDLVKLHPHILEFYKPAYSISKFLFENEELPEPLFDACPACKTEWAFDYTGKIYSCTATVGKNEEALGTFYPEIKITSSNTCDWETRDVISIPECRSCSLQLACGGGCGSVAKNKNGSILSPDCRPIKELLELGFAQYFENKTN